MKQIMKSNLYVISASNIPYSVFQHQTYHILMGSILCFLLCSSRCYLIKCSNMLALHGILCYHTKPTNTQTNKKRRKQTITKKSRTDLVISIRNHPFNNWILRLNDICWEIADIVSKRHCTISIKEKKN